MTRMTRMYWLAGISFLSLAVVGCVPQEKYNAMKLAHDSAMERLAQADAQAKAAMAESDARKQQLDTLMANSGNQGGLVANLTTQLTEMQSRYSDLERQYQDALNKQGTVTVALPQEVSTALTEFANQNPDLVDFDSTKGIVKFKSDVTFAVGSSELRPEARNAIARFAQILNLPAASGYELQVAGHTDSQRVSSPHTLAAGHKDNWYLSSHRAISVGKELQSQRVDARRIAVVGYADQHPIASNASEAGRAQNRRVEVLILPSQMKSSTIAEAPVAPPTAKAAPAAPVRKTRPTAELNKDSAGVDSRPIINK